VVLTAAEGGRGPGDDDLARSLDDLLSDRERLTRSLLGVGGPPQPPPSEPPGEGWTF
jgi:hypothetical protein